MTESQPTSLIFTHISMVVLMSRAHVVKAVSFVKAVSSGFFVIKAVSLLVRIESNRIEIETEIEITKLIVTIEIQRCDNLKQLERALIPFDLRLRPGLQDVGPDG